MRKIIRTLIRGKSMKAKALPQIATWLIAVALIQLVVILAIL